YKYLETGTLYYHLDDLSQAKQYLTQAQQYYITMNLHVHEDIGLMKNILGMIDNNQKKYQQAIAHLQSALKIYAALGKEKHRQKIANVHHNLCKAYIGQKQYAKASQQALLALQLNKVLNSDNYISLNLDALGTIEKKQGRYAAALAYYRAALDLRLKYANRSEIAAVYENIGDLFAEQQLFDKAFHHYQLAVEQLVPNFQNKDVFSQPILQDQLIVNEPFLLRLLDLKGQLHHQRFLKNKHPNDLDQAYNIYQQVDTLATQIRQNFRARGSKFLLQERAMPIYERAIETALSLYEQNRERQYLEKAYFYSTKNKAIVLLEQQQELDAKFASVPDSLLKKESDLNASITQTENQLYQLANLDESGDSLVSALKTQLFGHKRAYELLIEQLEKKYPDYHALKYAIQEPISIEAIQNQLPKEAAVIEYFTGEHHLYIFVISKNQFYHHVLAKPTHFETLCQNFRAMSDGRQAYEQDAFTKISNQLYVYLLEKPLGMLNPAINRLSIIPDGILTQISFELLPLKPNQVATKKQHFLLEQYAIHYAYSNEHLFQLSEKSTSTAPQVFAGFGLEYDAFTLDAMEHLPRTQFALNGQRGLGKLIYADDEVKAIAQLMNGQTWVNERATKKNFLQQAAHFQILHLAMHGLIDEENPLNSALIFSRPSDSTDFVLRASELYATRLNADLVVLSACHTGSGAIAIGEGVRSLARAFAHAGCPSLVSSLWSASDYSTKTILTDFYRYLKQGHAKDKALQLAKLDYLRQASPTQAAPIYWAHLAIFGNRDAVAVSTSSFRFGQLLGFGLAFVFLLFLFLRRVGLAR
ncbi:MAG: CHAT domain-containing tetratricopeptide repeat protein, partial [Bacteroidota bacterium]